MTFDLSDEQKMLAEHARALLAERSSYDRLRVLLDAGDEWDEALWREMAELGFLGAAIPERYGGLGLTALDQAVISEELGRANAAIPFFSSLVLVANAILLAGSEAQKAEWLPRIASGAVVATFAYSEGAQGWVHGLPETRFADVRISGTKSPVADAGVATIAVVLVRHEDRPALALVRLDQPGIVRTKLESFDQLRAPYRLDFDAAQAELLDAAPTDAVLDDLFDRAAVQAAFEAVGGAEACLYMARDHALERKIFGRPLAGYQAIKHKLADVLMQVELARSSARYAAGADGPEELSRAAAAARLNAIAAFETAARENMQVHGGIAHTVEANCHFHFRRERTLALSLGAREQWADRLIDGVVASHDGAAAIESNDTSEQAAFRAEARAWLRKHAPAQVLPVGAAVSDAEEVRRGRAWQRQLAGAGYAGIALPEEIGGRGGSALDALIFAEEEAAYALPKGPYIAIGQGMALAAIVDHGTPEQIERFVGPTLRGELTWCQLFSEPGAGSDLAAVRTKAEAQGDHWLVNGQKVWSSWAHEADWGLLLARSDPAVAKHKGLSFFLLDMKTPGIEVRPIRQISGASDFNETFLTDVRLSDDCRVGPVGGGWRCAMTVLGSERLNSGTEEPTRSVTELIAHARNTPRGNGSALESGVVRLSLATAYAQEQAERHFQARMRTAWSRGEDPGALPSIIKLSFASRLQKMAGFGLEMRGLAGLAPDPDDLLAAQITGDYVWSVAMRLAGGADEVLRNQLAERVLNMPGEQRIDKDVPFNTLG
jgi:alkylation response protein AidB-like acyl-CoA dehydrogenase